MEKETAKKKRKYNYKKIALLVSGGVIGLVLIINLFSLLVSLIFGHHINTDAKIIETDASSDYDYCRYNGDVLYMNSQGAKLYNDKDKIKSSVEFGSLNPYAEARGDYAVLCDMNSSRLALLYKGELIKNIELKEEVMFAKTNENGDIAAVTTEKGYKSSVYVYDKKGNEKYIWHSGTEYVIDCSLSKDAKKLVVLSSKSVDGKIVSTVTWFKTDEKQPYGQVILEDCFAYQLVYDNKDVNVISSKGIYRVNSDNIVNSVSFEGKTLLAFDCVGTDIITSQKLTNSKSIIVKYNRKLKPKFSTEIDFEANYLSCNNNKIALSGENNLLILTKWGNKYALGRTVGEATDILISENGNKIYSFGENKFKVYSVKLGRN